MPGTSAICGANTLNCGAQCRSLSNRFNLAEHGYADCRRDDVSYKQGDDISLGPNDSCEVRCETGLQPAAADANLLTYDGYSRPSCIRTRNVGTTMTSCLTRDSANLVIGNILKIAFPTECTPACIADRVLPDPGVRTSTQKEIPQCSFDVRSRDYATCITADGADRLVNGYLELELNEACTPTCADGQTVSSASLRSITQATAIADLPLCERHLRANLPYYSSCTNTADNSQNLLQAGAIALTGTQTCSLNCAPGYQARDNLLINTDTTQPMFPLCYEIGECYYPDSTVSQLTPFAGRFVTDWSPCSFCAAGGVNNGVRRRMLMPLPISDPTGPCAPIADVQNCPCSRPYVDTCNADSGTDLSDFSQQTNQFTIDLRSGVACTAACAQIRGRSAQVTSLSAIVTRYMVGDNPIGMVDRVVCSEVLDSGRLYNYARCLSSAGNNLMFNGGNLRLGQGDSCQPTCSANQQADGVITSTRTVTDEETVRCVDKTCDYRTANGYQTLPYTDACTSGFWYVNGYCRTCPTGTIYNPADQVCVREVCAMRFAWNDRLIACTVADDHYKTLVGQSCEETFTDEWHFFFDDCNYSGNCHTGYEKVSDGVCRQTMDFINPRLGLCPYNTFTCDNLQGRTCYTEQRTFNVSGRGWTSCKDIAGVEKLNGSLIWLSPGESCSPECREPYVPLPGSPRLYEYEGATGPDCFVQQDFLHNQYATCTASGTTTVNNLNGGTLALVQGASCTMACAATYAFTLSPTASVTTVTDVTIVNNQLPSCAGRVVPTVGKNIATCNGVIDGEGNIVLGEGASCEIVCSPGFDVYNGELTYTASTFDVQACSTRARYRHQRQPQLSALRRRGYRPHYHNRQRRHHPLTPARACQPVYRHLR